MVTGPSSGIGRATAVGLAKRGFHVVGAGRSEQRCLAVVERIVAEGGSAEFVHLDLASLESTRAVAQTLRRSGHTLDVLVNNAGIGVGRGVTHDGFEIHFGVNHLGHFLLTGELEPVLRPGTRVVQVSSAAHFNAEGIDFDLVTRRTRSLFGWKEYSVSKLANVLFVREGARRFPDWRFYAVHPGVTNTNIFPSFVRPFIKNRLLTPEQGSETVLRCASSSEVGDESGRYYRHQESVAPSVTAQDDELAAELWDRSGRWCAEHL